MNPPCEKTNWAFRNQLAFSKSTAIDTWFMLPRSNFLACRHCLYPSFRRVQKTTRRENSLFEKLAPESFFTEIMWAFAEIMCVYRNHVGRLMHAAWTIDGGGGPRRTADGRA